MPFMLSPGVQVTEKDLTNIVPAVSTSAGAFAGVFRWGPVMDPTYITSENELVSIFGSPNDGTFNSFFPAANFLAYANNLLVVRAATSNQRNAVSSTVGAIVDITIQDGGEDYYTPPGVSISAPGGGGVQAVATAEVSNGAVTGFVISNAGAGYSSATVTLTPTASGSGGDITTDINAGIVDDFIIVDAGTDYYVAPQLTFAAPPAGVTATGTAVVSGGQIVDVIITNGGTGYLARPLVTITPVASGSGYTVTAVIGGQGITINNADDYDTNYSGGAGTVGEFAAKYPGSLGNSLKVSMADADTYTGWDYEDEFDSAPTDNELHVIVVDEDGLVAGTAGGILERFDFLNKASNARKSDGTNVYYKEYLNVNSKYIYWMDHPTEGTDWGTEWNTGDALLEPLVADVTVSLTGGVDDFGMTAGQQQSAYALFVDGETYDISLIFAGKADAVTANYIIQNVAEVRKDCVTFCSAQNVSTGDPIIGRDTATAALAVAYRNLLTSSSYGVLDSGFKYQYDRYNDVYRWVALNGDIAGLCARTDYTDDPWFSPGGFNRGQIKNVVKLAFNPNQAARDILYKSGVNPVVSFPGQGTVLYGDKTLLAKPSAFDRINVRRLFIVLEKAIATAAKYQLFEFNDQFTRAQFKSMVEPFLRDVQGRRGVTDFRVKCDETNNTGEVIDGNRFVADIFIKPNRSINYITLNFIAARSSVSFEEIGA